MSGDQLDLDAIEARANAVPEGWDRWSDWQHYQILGLVTPTQIDGWAHPEKRHAAEARTDAAVAHIAGMDPATTLALVAELRRLREERILEERWVPVAESGERWVGRTLEQAEAAMKAYPAGGTYIDGYSWDGIAHIEHEQRYVTEWTVVQ